MALNHPTTKERYCSEIKGSIEKMPEKLGQAFKLYVIDDMSFSDISKSLKIAEQTAKNRVHRARAYIRKSTAV